jgi:hypothetical protein
LMKVSHAMSCTPSCVSVERIQLRVSVNIRTWARQKIG